MEKSMFTWYRLQCWWKFVCFQMEQNKLSGKTPSMKMKLPPIFYHGWEIVFSSTKITSGEAMIKLCFPEWTWDIKELPQSKECQVMHI